MQSCVIQLFPIIFVFYYFLIKHLLFVVFDESKHYFDITVGFRGLENIGLAYLFKFLS